MLRSFFNLRAPAVRWAAFAAVLGGFALTSLPAAAMGTARIQQADGSADTYSGVKIQIVDRSLTMTSADGKGSLIIYRAACSYQGEIMMCLPLDADLVQNGAVNKIKFTHGTIYLNLTGDNQQLALSSTKIPAHSVMLAVTTKAGTYVTLSGRIDTVSK